jgi:AcrR family transcriptional regulator
MSLQNHSSNLDQSIRMRKAARNREEILTVARRLILEKGYQGFSMDELARSALFSKRTVYVYFPGKHELFLALVHRVFVTLNDFIGKRISNVTTMSGLEQVKELGTMLVDFYREHPGYFTIIADYENQEDDFKDPGETAAACYREGEIMMSALKKILSRGVQDGSIRNTIDIDNIALLLWSFFTGIIITLSKKPRYLIHMYNMEPENLIAQAYLFIEKALQSERS